MAGEKDLFGKADALLRRASGATGTETGAFPILTDLIDQGPQQPAVESSRPPAEAITTVEAEDAAVDLPLDEPPPASAAAPGPSALHDDELAREVFTRVMAEVEGRLAADLEERLAQHLVPAVHAIVAAALGDLRQELANAIGDAVARAMEQRRLK